MKFIRAGALCLSFLTLSLVARAQEGEARVVDEIVARVNSSVILRSAYLRAQQEILDELKGRGLKDAELEKQFNEMKSVVLDSLIDTELLMQRSKDLSIDVEPQVNQQLLRVMKENNLNSIEDLEQKMREVGVDIQEVRRMLRSRFASEAVRNREVFAKIYHGLTEKEKRDYYEQHKEIFSSIGEVTLSRILISAGKDSAQALERAKDVVSKARAEGADFAALARQYSEDDNAKKGGAIPQPFKVTELAAEVRSAVGQSPVGTISDPIKLDNGYAIFRVDAKKEPVIRSFDEKEVEDEVAQRVTYERGSTELEKYLEKIRSEAFIEVDPRYQLAESKIKSAQIKRVQPGEESSKDRKKREKKEKKDEAKEAPKAAAAAPAKP